MRKNVELARKITRLMINKLPKDKDTLINVQNFLNIIADLYKRDKDFRNFMVNPSIPVDKKLKVIENLMEKMNIPKELNSSFEYIISINAVSILPEIRRFFEHEVEKLMKLSKGKLIVSQKVDKRLVGKISKILESKLGRKVELDIEENPEIIGGFVLKTHGFIIDASVKRELEKIIKV